MNWKSLLADLATVGVKQAEIGAAIGLSQPAVSDLARGRTSRLEWAAGQALIELHRQHCTTQAQREGREQTKEAA